jgi:energy-coupling factor transporter ATP-binding protein EcfA2
MKRPNVVSQTMKINSVEIHNFRTIESLRLDFHPTYTAMCGPNDSGKTNVVRALRALLKEKDDDLRFSLDDPAGIAFKDDYPKWKEASASGEPLMINAELEIDQSRDAGVFQSVTKQLSIESPPPVLRIQVSNSHVPGKATTKIVVKTRDKEFTGLEAEEVLSRIQSATCIIVHNSTQTERRIYFGGGSVAGFLEDLSSENQQLLGKMQKTVSDGLAKIAKGRQREYEELLGKLERKYKVGLSLPRLEVTDLPYGITLGEPKFQVRLDDWGSGTRNRTQILLKLFAAKKIAESEDSARKTTPVMIIEEPECFLHPSAQAEFGHVIRDLADEFSVQVIMTTHSPYMLSMRTSESNVLLRRRVIKDQMRQTERVDTTGDNWMRPFAEALGLDSEEFEPWKRMFSAVSERILLVEGSSDKEYFEMLRKDAHGPSRLCFDGEILPYEGAGALANPTMLRFFQNRYQKVFVTFDLDSAVQIEKTLQRAGLQKDFDYVAVGVNSPGRRNIEGLIPDSIKATVRARFPELVDAAVHGTGEDQKSARNKLKVLYLQEVQNSTEPASKLFADFYPIVAKINKGLGLPKRSNA